MNNLQRYVVHLNYVYIMPGNVSRLVTINQPARGLRY